MAPLESINPMRKNVRWKAVLIAAVAGVCIWSAYPPEEKIKLGLDLQGGIHVIMKVNMDDALNAITDESMEALGLLLDDQQVSFGDLEKDDVGRLRVTGLSADSDGDFRNVIEENLPGWDAVRAGEGEWRLDMRQLEVNQIREETLAQAIETIRRRVDALGVAEPVIAPHGDMGDQILVQLPGFDDVERAKSIIKNTAQLELQIVEAVAPTREQLENRASTRLEIVPGVSQTGSDDRVYYLLDSIPVITGRDLKNARVATDYDTNMTLRQFHPQT